MDLSGDTEYAIDLRISGGLRLLPGSPSLIRWTPSPILSNGRALTGYRADNGELHTCASVKVICTWAQHEQAIADAAAARQRQREEYEALAAAQKAEREADRLRREGLTEMFGEDAWRLPYFAQVSRTVNRESNNGNIRLEHLALLLNLAYQKGRNDR